MNNEQMQIQDLATRLRGLEAQTITSASPQPFSLLPTLPSIFPAPQPPHPSPLRLSAPLPPGNEGVEDLRQEVKELRGLINKVSSFSAPLAKPD